MIRIGSVAFEYDTLAIYTLTNVHVHHGHVHGQNPLVLASRSTLSVTNVHPKFHVTASCASCRGKLVF